MFERKSFRSLMYQCSNGNSLESDSVSSFVSPGLITLIKVKINSHEIISERASAKIRETIVRMGFFTLFIFIFVVATFVVHIYEFQRRKSWKESFRTYMM